MAIKYSFTMTDADIAKAIPSLQKRSATIRADIHKVAVSILTEWCRTGDVATAARRAGEMLSINEDYAQKVVNWFAVHAGFELNEDADGFVYGEQTTINKTGVQAAKAETMFELTKPASLKPFDLPARIQSLITAAEKRRAKGLTEDDNASEAQIKALKAALAAV